jgi:hypothetical protein
VQSPVSFWTDEQCRISVEKFAFAIPALGFSELFMQLEGRITSLSKVEEVNFSFGGAGNDERDIHEIAIRRLINAERF